MCYSVVLICFVSCCTHTSQYLRLLQLLVEVAHSLHLWQTDALLHGELCLKLACLYEAKADLRQDRHGSKTTSTVMLDEGLLLLYDRKQLLECLDELEQGLKCVQMARARVTEESKGAERDTEIGVLHAEYMYSVTRVKVKLASTIPPPRE